TPPPRMQSTRTARAVEVRGRRGRLFAAPLAENSDYYYFEGHVEQSMFEATIGPAEEATRSGNAILFGDAEHWQTYDTACRDAWTRWFTAHRRSHVSSYLVTGSRLIRMGVQVVNLVTSDSVRIVPTVADLARVMRTTVLFDAERDTRDWPGDMR